MKRLHSIKAFGQKRSRLFWKSFGLRSTFLPSLSQEAGLWSFIKYFIVRENSIYWAHLRCHRHYTMTCTAVGVSTHSQPGEAGLLLLRWNERRDSNSSNRLFQIIDFLCQSQTGQSKVGIQMNPNVSSLLRSDGAWRLSSSLLCVCLCCLDSDCLRCVYPGALFFLCVCIFIVDSIFYCNHNRRCPPPPKTSIFY